MSPGPWVALRRRSPPTSSNADAVEGSTPSGGHVGSARARLRGALRIHTHAAVRGVRYWNPASAQVRADGLTAVPQVECYPPRAVSTLASKLRLAFAFAAMGCMPDAWVVLPRQDAGAEDVSPVVDESGACARDSESACGCRSEQPRCDTACVDGPRSLFRGEGDARDGAGSQHATQSSAGFMEGRVGQAFAFGGDRTRQYVTLPPGVLDFDEGDFTVSFWFASPLNGNLLSKRAACWGGPASTGLDLRLTYAGEIIMELWTTTGLFMHRTPPGLNDGAWHHVAIVRDRSTARFYVDGAALSTIVLTGALRDPTDTPVYLGVGRCVPGAPGSNGNQDGSTWLDGRVDEVAFLPRALSEPALLTVVLGRCVL